MQTNEPDRHAIARWIHGRADEMAALLADLIAIPTENPPGANYAACVHMLERRLHNAGLRFERFESNSNQAAEDDAGICLLGEHGAGDRILYFHGHYDVVPAQTRTQFEPRRDKHFLFGRGSCDMKGGIVAMLYAIRALKECGAVLSGRIGLMLVCDEETGGKRGSARLAKEKLLGRGGIGMITAEPTSGVVWNANRGAITLRITVHGKSAHVGLQHKGENAFERMHRVVAKLLELKHEVERRETSHACGEPDTTEGQRPGAKHGPRHSILMIGGASAGGTNFNVVPEACWFTVDRRINPEENLQTEKCRLTGLLESCRQEGIPLDWEILQEGSASASSEHEKLGRALAKNIESVAGAKAKFEMCPGLLETRFYAEIGMPAYAYGPGLLSVAHGPNEYVDLRRVEECAVIYALTAQEILR